MRVGVIVDNEYHLDVRVKREVRLLEDFGYQVYVLCLSFSRQKESHSNTTTIRSHYLPRKAKDFMYFFMNTIPLYEWWWKRKVKRFVDDFELDVVHTHDLYMAKCVKKGIDASKAEVPMILDLHENYPYAIKSYKWTQGFPRSILVRPRVWEKKESKYLRYADRLIVLSEDFKQSLLNRNSFLKSEHITVFPNVVDTEEFDNYEVKTVEGKLLGGPRILYFGVVANRRGIFRTLRSCEELINQGKKFSLVIIGPVDAGDRDSFFRELNKPVFKNHIAYIPWIDLSELPSYLRACDIALAPFDKNPQHESGIANKIFQYMYGKLPILASDCKPQKELIEKYKIGKIFTSDDELTNMLIELIDNKQLCTEMGERAYETLMKHFHQNAFRSSLQSLYESLFT